MTQLTPTQEARRSIIDNLKDVVVMRREHHAKIQEKLEYARAEASHNRGRHEGETLDWLMKEIAAENERFLQESGVNLDKSITILRDAMMTDLKAAAAASKADASSVEGQFLKIEDVQKLLNDNAEHCASANTRTKELAIKYQSLILSGPGNPQLLAQYIEALEKLAAESTVAFVDSTLDFTVVNRAGMDLLTHSSLKGKLVLEDPVPKETPP